MFEEVPIVIKNSHLVNVLSCELEEKAPTGEQVSLFGLGHRVSADSIISSLHFSRAGVVQYPAAFGTENLHNLEDYKETVANI